LVIRQPRKFCGNSWGIFISSFHFQDYSSNQVVYGFPQLLFQSREWKIIFFFFCSFVVSKWSGDQIYM